MKKASYKSSQSISSVRKFPYDKVETSKEGNKKSMIRKFELLHNLRILKKINLFDATLLQSHFQML